MICAGIILAAGFSRRMGTDKARLPLGGKTAVERIIDCHRTAGISQVIVVTGENSRHLWEMKLDAAIRETPSPEKGMFFSIKTGIMGLAPETEGVFIHPVDIPLVESATLEQLRQAAMNLPESGAFIPVHGGRRGHPPLLRIRLKAEILSDTGSGGLRNILHRHRISEVICADEAILRDMDTPDAYRRLCETCANSPANYGGRKNDHPIPFNAGR